jgi:hypothetical protein
MAQVLAVPVGRGQGKVAHPVRGLARSNMAGRYGH